MAAHCYEYVALLDDDIKFEIAHGIHNNPIQMAFEICTIIQPRIASPSQVHNDPMVQTSHWSQCHHIENALYHYTNFVETNSMFIRNDCINYLMEHYPFEEIKAWGQIFGAFRCLGAYAKSDYLIIDLVKMCNPSNIAKGVQKREIETAASGQMRKATWEL